MSTYYVGPFGRMLPSTDCPSPEREPVHPANVLVSENHPYQLPPPRTLESLQFGTDPFLHHRNHEGKGDSRVRSSAPGRLSGVNEQLPSVSELLTPSARSSQSSSPHRPYMFGWYTSEGESSNTGRTSHSDLNNGPQTPQSGINGRSESHVESYSRPATANLPSLSQMSMYSPASEPRAHTASRADFSLQLSPHSVLPAQGYMYHDNENREDDSSPTANEFGAAPGSRPQSAKVRPHVVDERYIDGEGVCYIYADGSHCPKIIDGVPVNANWGVTKAGKPRKRLAQACLICREKKIKCQPNLPKCDQCQKSGRECKFESAPRGNRPGTKASPQSTRHDSRDSSLFASHNPSNSSDSIYSIVRASESSTSLPGTNSQSPVSDASMLTPPAVNNSQESGIDPEDLRRIRLQSLGRISAGVEDLSGRSMDGIPARVMPDYTDILKDMKELDPQSPLAHEWNTDPFKTDAELTIHYIESYFTHVNDSLYYIFPRRRFLLWLRSCHTKSLEDNMLLYSMMSLGAIFSDRPDRLTAMRRVSRTARYAVDHSRHNLSLQLAQSRIIMSLWYYAIGALEKSWDSVGAAVRTVCGLRYNVESGGVIVDQSRVCEYGLHPQALIECRRRTFWVTFLMDRLTCLYSPTSTFMSPQTAYIRLPCREEIFEAQQYTTVPYFQDVLNQPPVTMEHEASKLSAMALLVEIVSLWGEVSDHVVRLALLPAETSSTAFEALYSTIVQRADALAAGLPEHLQFTALNLERSIQVRKLDAFISIHVLYHATLMKLNRHARCQNSHIGSANRYVRATRNHAAEILRITLSLTHYISESDSVRVMMEAPSSATAIFNPFLGYVILSAVDVLTAAGLIADMPECVNLIRGGLEAVKELGRFWDSSSSLVSLIERRLEALSDPLYNPMDLERKAVFITKSQSLDNYIHNQQNPNSEDLFYGALPHGRLLSALGFEDVSLSEANILWITDKD